jgi:CheY-like chemotaxis protein
MARILLIEDDPTVRAVLRMSLTGVGHTVIEARDGKEGLDLFKRVGADLVITDIIMPEKEGLEVLRELKKKQVPPVKVIAISGGGVSQSAGDALRMAKLLGAAKTLAKPFSNEVLIAAVNEVLQGGGTKTPPPAAH